MNDEIKEILKYMKIKQYISETNINFGYKTLSAGQVELLLDYITTLQNRITELEEISKQHQELNGMLNQRINRADELLELKQLRYLNEDSYKICTLDLQEVRNILQGSDSIAK